MDQLYQVSLIMVVSERVVRRRLIDVYYFYRPKILKWVEAEFGEKSSGDAAQ